MYGEYVVIYWLSKLILLVKVRLKLSNHFVSVDAAPGIILRFYGRDQETRHTAIFIERHIALAISSCHIYSADGRTVGSLIDMARVNLVK